ncbi:hypothetical protein OG411_17275 [Streptomyces pseudogriseolus]|uniref:hypothetical protein n=1 Tax=Streptomyces pseudogriseolus TaxID=36817 RepID=UPI003248F611
MAFPDTPLDLRLELLVDGAWAKVPTYARDRVEVETGRRDRAAVTDPGSLGITINNRAGRYSPRNPLSDLYGKIGRNTPCRLSVPGSESYLELRDKDGYASTPDTAALDVTGSLDLRWEGEADWYAAGHQFLLGKWGAPGQRSYHLRLQDGYLVMHAATDGFTGLFGGQLLPALPRRAALRATLTIGGGNWTIRTYWAETMDGPWTQFGTDYVAASTASIWAGTAPLRIAPPEQLDSTPPRRPVTGRCYRAEVRNGVDGTVVARPDFRALAGGTTSFTDSAGRAWTVAGTAAVRDRADLFIGEVSEWPQEWTMDEADAWVPIEGAGILRRLGQGRKPLQSPLRRRLPSARPLVYWPMEDGASAVQAASALDGGLPLRVTGFQFASEDSLPSSEALPVLGQAATLYGAVPGATAGGWHAELVYKLAKLPATEQTFLRLRLAPGTGGVVEIRVRVSTTAIKMEALNADGGVVAWFQNDTGGVPAFTGSWNRLQIFSSVSGGQARATVAWRDVITGVWWYIHAPWTGTPGRVVAVQGAWGTDFQGLAMGHLAVWDTGSSSPTAPAITVYEGSDDGYNGETAWARMLRLTTEENLPLARLAGPETPQRVGPQTVDTMLNLLQAAADADGGLLLEDRRRAGLLYRDRSSMYSQTPKLTLSYNQRPGLKAPLVPVDDDTAVRNDRTVKRAGGSEARAVLEDGPLSVQNPPAGIGVYDDSVTLALYSDAQAAPIAYWRLHLGTVDTVRYPTVRIMLHKAPELIPQILALSEGDLVRITDLPLRVGSGYTDLIVEGIRHEASLHSWEVELSCSPGDPWRVAQTAIHENFEDTTYAVQITNGGNLPWLRTNIHSYTGSWSLRCGVISNNQTSDAIVSVPPGMQTLTFSYRVSSEPAGTGFEGDRFLVLVDGVQVLRAQGTTAVWTRATIDVAGKGRVTFRYAKDNSTASGEDAAWIDDLVFAGASPIRVDSGTSTLTSAVTAGATTLSVSAQVPWSTSPVDVPLDIQAGGEVMRVTAISGSTSPQTFTVVRAVNGISKPHAAGTPVRLADTPVVAL